MDENVEEILRRLTDKNAKEAYEFAKQISIESASTNKYLEMIPEFSKLLKDESSYIRTRAFILICAQARWANERQIDRIFEQMLFLLNDPKPVVVRQSLKALHEVALFRPELSKKISNAIRKIDLSRYKDSMAPLIEKDIKELEDLL